MKSQPRSICISSCLYPMAEATRSPAVRSGAGLGFDSQEQARGRILFFVAIMGNLLNFYPPLSLFVSRVCM